MDAANLKAESWDGVVLTAVGSFMQIVGAYQDAAMAAHMTKSKAMDYEFQASLADLNARAAERDAQRILADAQQTRALTDLAHAQEREAYRAQAGASGAVVGDGSSAEIAASYRYAQAVDAYSIRVTAARDSAASRRGALNERLQGQGLRASAANIRASTTNPFLAAAPTLITSAAGLHERWLKHKEKYGS